MNQGSKPKDQQNPLCIHGHFYQPSRIDPFSESLPEEIGAAPYKNWNEKINANCYYPNSKLGNFACLSFDIGPTLWNWFERYASETYDLIINQEHAVYEEYGVSNCMAQPYHHTILPLSNREDKITQIRWGILDYKHRLGHDPQGMWLPETAVDEETLEILIQERIQFTFLAPWQIGNFELYKPVLSDHKNGRLVIFPYHKEISASFSFEPNKTTNADRFSAWLAKNRQLWNNGQLPIIATDGELYGHHQPFRDYFLQRLFKVSLHQARINPTFPSLWLQNNHVGCSGKIIENTSWSCAHGIERWKGPCDCTFRGDWKYFLREGLSKISEEIDKVFLEKMSRYVANPFEIRHNYLRVINRTINLSELLSEYGCRMIDQKDLQIISLLLDSQTERQRMFTSCGWFFEDFARIEPVNNIKYAAKAIWLTKEACGIDLSDFAIRQLEAVRSWRTDLNGSDVLRQQLERATE